MNRVELWIDPVSEDEQSFHSILFHTSICVEFEENVKYLFSYNEDGLSCLPAVRKFSFCVKSESEVCFRRLASRNLRKRYIWGTLIKIYWKSWITRTSCRGMSLSKFKGLKSHFNFIVICLKIFCRKYAAIGKNCNHFCNKLSLWLCEKQIPDKYLGQDVGLVKAAGVAGIVAIGGLVGVVGIAPVVTFGVFNLLGALLRR